MIIEVEKLCFGYGSHKVLNDISFNVEKGKLISIIGPNGVGKSTLFRCILGLIGECSGIIRIEGNDIKKLSAKSRAHLMAYIPQIHYPSFNYSVMDMVLMGTAHQLSAYSKPGKKEMEQAWKALAQLSITGLAQRGFSRLSGGEQQLVLIARALAQQAGIILMDEPTSSLDFGNQLRVLQQIKNLTKEGYTVLISMHNPQHALTYSDYILALFDGSIIADGTPQEVINEDLLSRLYNVEVQIAKVGGDMLIVPSGKGGVDYV
jgi:iron complex transport system ATP-binding protein